MLDEKIHRASSYAHWKATHVSERRIAERRILFTSTKSNDVHCDCRIFSTLSCSATISKKFKQDRGEMILSLEKFMDEELLDNLYKNKVERSSFMKNTWSLYQSDVVLKWEWAKYSTLQAFHGR